MLNFQSLQFTLLNSQINYCNGWLAEESFIADCRLCFCNHLNSKGMALLAACCPALLSQHKAVAAVVAVSAWGFSEKGHVRLFLWHMSKFYLKSTRNKKVNGNFQNPRTQPSLHNISCQKRKVFSITAVSAAFKTLLRGWRDEGRWLRKNKIRGLALLQGKKAQTIFRLCNMSLIKISYNFCFRKVGILVFWWMLCMSPYLHSFISWNKLQLSRCSVLIRALTICHSWESRGQKGDLSQAAGGSWQSAAGWHRLAGCHGLQTVSWSPGAMCGRRNKRSPLYLETQTGRFSTIRVWLNSVLWRVLTGRVSPA